jgi:hypothetical protein
MNTASEGGWSQIQDIAAHLAGEWPAWSMATADIAALMAIEALVGIHENRFLLSVLLEINFRASDQTGRESWLDEAGERATLQLSVQSRTCAQVGEEQNENGFSQDKQGLSRSSNRGRTLEPNGMAPPTYRGWEYQEEQALRSLWDSQGTQHKSKGFCALFSHNHLFLFTFCVFASKRRCYVLPTAEKACQPANCSPDKNQHQKGAQDDQR